MAFKGRSYGNNNNNNNSRKAEYQNIGTLYISFNEKHDGSTGKGSPPIATGVFELISDVHQEEPDFVSFALWPSRSDGILASGKLSDGRAMFLRRSDRDNMLYYGNVVDVDDNGEIINGSGFNFSIFDQQCFRGLASIKLGDTAPQQQSRGSKPKSGGGSKPPRGLPI